MELMDVVARRVRSRRLGLGLSQGELAGRAHVSRRFVSQLEAGDGNATVRRLADVCRVLALPLDELFRAIRAPQSSIALVGLRGAGKSTVGRALAAELDVEFVELDALVEREAAMSLEEIFEFHGPAFYREAEARALEHAFASAEPRVVAVGGSLVTAEASWRRLRDLAVTVWLRASPGSHFERVTAQGDLRPMVGRPNAKAEIEAILEQRGPLYAMADLELDTDSHTVDELVAQISSGGRAQVPTAAKAP